ncbi:MAG TPA: S26 family signal peptidase [Planctomycetota bacterium]|nr:S26 family signal peptidase [Planctomycetota bacterium]
MTKRQRMLAWALALALPPLFVRGCLLDSYAIQSASMEPAFHGDDGGGGDQLLVLRHGADPRDLQRFDAVVLDGSIDPELPAGVGAVLKRVAGLPGEYLHVEGGDLFAGPGPRPPLVRKPDALVQGLLVPMAESDTLDAPWTWVGPGTREPLPGGGVRLSAGSEEALALYGQLIDDGLPGRPGRESVADTALRAEVGEGDATLELTLREGADLFKARLGSERAGGGATLWHNLGGVVASDPGFPGLRPGQSVLVWNVDNGLRLRVDGEPVLAWDYERNAPQPPGAPWHNEPSLAVQAGSLELRRVAVLRDLHYGAQGVIGTGADNACHIGPALLFVLGDHSADSRDSRYVGPVPLDSVRGRPIAIYRPASRRAWLDPAGLP